MRPHAVTQAGSDTFGYNANGSMTSRTIAGVSSTLAWDVLGRLSSVTQGANVTSFIYDANGQRLLRKEPGGVVTLYMENQEVRLSGGSTTATRHYQHGATGPTVAMRKTGTGAGLYWLAGDHQRTLQLSVNSSTGSVARQRYTPFGASRGPANQLPLDRGFLDQVEDDTTGLTYLNARYYDPVLARFVQPRPVCRFLAMAPATY